MARDPQLIFSVEEARRLARRRLPRLVFDYIDGAAGDEVTAQSNLRAFQEIELRPALPQQVTTPTISTTVLGTEVTQPVLLGPCGLVSLMAPAGAVLAAKAAASAGTISITSTVAGTQLEAVAAEAPGHKWFQVYAPEGLTEASALAERAAAAGFDGLMVTVDTAVLGKRERDLRHGITMPPKASLRLAARLIPQVLARPAWTVGFVQDVRGRKTGRPGGGTPGATGTDAASYEAGLQLPNMAACPLTWEDISRLRRQWDGAFIVKGVLTGTEATRAVDAGADAVVVSNHGGRQLDGAPATMKMLPEVLDAIGDRVEVLVDGGVRRGTDVARALALGARAVLVGRPYLYGLAAAGQAGVERVLDVLALELSHTLTLLGLADITQLNRDVLVRPPSIGTPT